MDHGSYGFPNCRIYFFEVTCIFRAYYFHESDPILSKLLIQIYELKKGSHPQILKF